MTPNENERNLKVEELESSSSSSAASQLASKSAKAIADATFARLDRATRSSFFRLRVRFIKVQYELAAADAERDETWRELPDDVQKSLSKATWKKPTGESSDFLYLKPEEFPLEKFNAVIRARRRQLQARKFFHIDRAKFRDPLIDRFLLRCSDSDSVDAPFPSEEFESNAEILKNLQLCDSIEEAMKRAEERWKNKRPCVVANNLREFVEGETGKEKRRRLRKIKRQMFREYASSDDWKSFRHSIAAIARSALVSTICVVLIWLAIFKWNLVYLLRYESIFPYKSDAYRFLYIMTPVVWVALAFAYRNFVLFRQKFHTTFKKFKKEVADAEDSLR